jgi:hypothetical protein
MISFISTHWQIKKGESEKYQFTISLEVLLLVLKSIKVLVDLKRGFL